MKNSIKGIKNELASIGNRVEQTEKKISDSENRNVEMMQRKEERDLSIKNEISDRTVLLYQKEQYIRIDIPAEKKKKEK